VSINGFNDQQDFRFFVSAANIQMDCLATEGNEDFSWMRYGKQSHYHRFWMVVEMKIPYAALRFSNAKNKLGIELYA
jgi:hypothetical protein